MTPAIKLSDDLRAWAQEYRHVSGNSSMLYRADAVARNATRLEMVADLLDGAERTLVSISHQARLIGQDAICAQADACAAKLRWQA